MNRSKREYSCQTKSQKSKKWKKSNNKKVYKNRNSKSMPYFHHNHTTNIIVFFQSALCFRLNLLYKSPFKI